MEITMNRHVNLVSARAAQQRINRKLRPSLQMLRKSRRWSSDTGSFYLLDLGSNWLVQGHVDVEALGRELGVLDAHESVREPA